MKVQYSVLFAEGADWYFSFREPTGIAKQKLPDNLSLLSLLDGLGSNGWELCDKNNILPPASSPEEWVFLRRLP
jgi:hypothetical protein